jgi:hypothetical protein
MIRAGLYEKYIEWMSEEAMDSKGQSDRIDGAINHIPQDVKSVFCIGVGDGSELSMLVDRGKECKGITLNMDAVKFVKDHAEWGDMHDLHEEDASYDLTFSKDCFEHAFSHWAALSEMTRISKKYVMIVVPFVKDWSSGQSHTIVPNDIQLKSLAEKFKLHLVDTWELNGTDGYLFEK